MMEQPLGLIDEFPLNDPAERIRFDDNLKTDMVRISRAFHTDFSKEVRKACRFYIANFLIAHTRHSELRTSLLRNARLHRRHDVVHNFLVDDNDNLGDKSEDLVRERY